MTDDGHLLDVTIRGIPGSIWWRVHLSWSWRRGGWESGRATMYAGLIRRWAVRVGPLNAAAMRLR